MSAVPAAGDSRKLKLVRAWYSLGALMLIVIAAVSLLPAPATGVSDKLAHLLTYVFVTGWFALIARNGSVLGWSIFGLLCYGMIIELLQAQTGYRHAEWGDVLANSAGCGGGGLLYFTPLRGLLYRIDAGLYRRLGR